MGTSRSVLIDHGPLLSLRWGGFLLRGAAFLVPFGPPRDFLLVAGP
jgi:hypothetical protein